MAKTHKISLYAVDVGERFDQYTLKAGMLSYLYKQGLLPRQFHIETSEPYVWCMNTDESYDDCDLAKLEKRFSKSSCHDLNRIVVGGTYRHFKGKIIKVIAVSKDTEHPSHLCVVYMDANGDVWHRPLEMFVSKVDMAKYPDAAQEYRFELVKTEGDS